MKAIDPGRAKILQYAWNVKMETASHLFFDGRLYLEQRERVRETPAMIADITRPEFIAFPWKHPIPQENVFISPYDLGDEIWYPDRKTGKHYILISQSEKFPWSITEMNGKPTTRKGPAFFYFAGNVPDEYKKKYGRTSPPWKE